MRTVVKHWETRPIKVRGPLSICLPLVAYQIEAAHILLSRCVVIFVVLDRTLAQACAESCSASSSLLGGFWPGAGRTNGCLCSWEKTCPYAPCHTAIQVWLPESPEGRASRIWQDGIRIDCIHLHTWLYSNELERLRDEGGIFCVMKQPWLAHMIAESS